MRFDLRQYFTLARELASHPDNEAAMRSAISRAYYAAYNTAARHKGTRGVAATREGSHRGVWEELRRSGNIDWRRAGNKGRDFLELRRAADYEDEVSNLRNGMYGALNTADEILRLLNA